MRTRTPKRMIAVFLSLILAFSPILSMGVFASPEELADAVSAEDLPDTSDTDMSAEDLPDIGDMDMPVEVSLDIGDMDMPVGVSLETGDTDTPAEEDPLDIGDIDMPAGDSLDTGDTDTPAGENPVFADIRMTALPISDIEWVVQIIQGENGTITADLTAAKAGAVVTLTASPDEDCGLAVGSIKVVTDSQGATRVVRGSGMPDDPFWFTMPDDSVTVTSEFVRYRSIIIADDIAHGTIVVSAENNMAIKNELITITLVPDEGYRQKFNSTTNNANKSLTFTDALGGAVRYNEAVWGSGIWDYSPTGTYTWPLYDDARLVGEQTRDLNMAADTYYLRMPDCDIILTVEFAMKFQVNVLTENGTFGFVERGRTEASEGERVSWVIAVPDAGYQLVADSITVTSDTTNEAIIYNANYTEFMMPESNVTVSALFEPLPPPPELEVQPFTAIAGDEEIVFSWSVHELYSSYSVNYRPTGSEDAYMWRSYYAGGYAIGSTYTATLSGLENDTEYEIYLSCGAAITPMVYATPTGMPPTGVTIFNNALAIPVGQTANMYATVEPIETKSNKLIWTSSDESIATVDINSGKIIAVSSGTATISAMTAANHAITDTCAVTVAETVEHFGGSAIIGSLSGIDYNSTGVTVEVPFTFIVPLNRPIFKANFDFAMTATYGRITDVSIDGMSLKDANALNVNNAITIGDSRINIGALPKTTGASSQWGVIQPANGRMFLEPGKAYDFVLTVEVLGTSPPDVPINFSNVTNYRYSFYYYDYDNSPTGSFWSSAELARAGTIHLNWTGEGIPTSGSGTTLTYNISTANDLLWFASELAKGSDKAIVDPATGATAWITLYDDIDLTGMDFAGIGTEEYPYNAYFLGQNHKITYNRTVSTDGAVGLFNYVSGGFISGVIAEGSITVTDGDVCVGGLVGKVSGTGYVSSNCVNYVDISVIDSAGGYVGGFIGYAETSSTSNVVSSGKNYGTVNATGTGVLAVGGHIGAYVNSNGNIGGDSGGNWGDITGRGFVGGIVGLAQYAETANNKGVWENQNYGKVTALSGTATGGIAGAVIHAHIGGSYAGASSYGNKNYGDVTGSTLYIGGIAGYADNHESEWITYNYNEGKITSTLDTPSYIGGIVAYLTGSLTVNVSNNINKAELAGENAVMGGIVAEAANEWLPTLCTGNYYAEFEGLLDALGAQAAQIDFLSPQGWSPMYTDKGMGENGSPERPYLLADAYDFLWFTNQVNDKSGGLPFTSPGKDYSVKLVADIDLSDYPAYQGVGTVTGSYPLQAWYGTFDGDGFSITVALDGNTPGAVSDSVAIFRNINNATIMNLTVYGSVMSRVTGGSAAGLALACDGTVFENVTNYADVTAFSSAAGIANGRPKSLYQVYNYGKIIGGDAAGLTNNMYGGGGAFIRDCANFGEILGVARAAGIVSIIAGGDKSADRLPSCFVENVTNHASVTQTGVAVKDAIAWYNAGDWTSSHFAAGIIGKVEGVIVDIKNVTNNGTIIGTGNNVGGIIGVINHTGGGGDGDNYTDTDVRISEAVNNGNVASAYNGDDPLWLEQISVGGIVGNTAGDFGNTGLGEQGFHPGQTENLVIRDSINNGEVSGPVGANVGAIAGLTSNTESGKVSFTNNYNSGAIEGGEGKWGDQSQSGTTYDPDTHEIVGGVLVEKESGEGEEKDEELDDQDEQETPEEPGDTTIPGNSGAGESTTPSGNSDTPNQAPLPQQPAPSPFSANTAIPDDPPPLERAAPITPDSPAAPDAPRASTPSTAAPRPLTAPIIIEENLSDMLIVPENTEDRSNEPQNPAPPPEPERTASAELPDVVQADIVRETSSGGRTAMIISVTVIAAAALVAGGFWLYRKRKITTQS